MGTLRPGLLATLGGFNGAMTAVFGMVFGMMLTVLGATYALGVALPPIIVGSGVSAAVVSLVPFRVNLLGGFVGGTLGKSSARGEAAQLRKKAEASPSARSTAG